MKKFETQVCQFIVSLIRDSMETDYRNDAAKKLKELASAIADRDRILCPVDPREGKHFWSEDFKSLRCRDLFALTSDVRLNELVGDYLREFYLFEWWYDDWRTISINDFWELNYFGFKVIRENELSRDNPEVSITRCGGFILDNLRMILVHRNFCEWVLTYLQLVQNDQSALSDIVSSMFDDSRGMWLNFKDHHSFDMVSSKQLTRLLDRIKRQMEVFVRQLDNFSWIRRLV